MIKYVPKENLSYEKGYLIDAEGNVVNNRALVEQAIRVDIMAQMVVFYQENKQEVDAYVDSEKPVMKLQKDKPYVVVDTKTENLDSCIEMVKGVFDDIEDVESARKIQSQMNDMPELIDFITSDSVLIDYDHCTTERIPINILNIELDDLQKMMTLYYDNHDKMRAITVEG